MARTMRDLDDLLLLLDRVFAEDEDRWTLRGSGWWDDFYRDRGRPVPFFDAGPDECLVDWHARGLLPESGRALDIGCGGGRNALWLQRQGFRVDGVDLSGVAIAWARQRADAMALRLRLMAGDVFSQQELGGDYQVIYDSGYFHHLPPHRRISYLQLLSRALAVGGVFGLACFASPGMGSEAPDADLYRSGSLAGGVAYTDADLRTIFSGYDEVELRRMRDIAPGMAEFGQSFLWAALFRRRS